MSNDANDFEEKITKLDETETLTNSEEFDKKIKKLCNLWNEMNYARTPRDSLLKLLSKETEFPNKYEVMIDIARNCTSIDFSFINILLSKETEFPDKYEFIMNITNNFIDYIKNGSFIVILNTLLLNTTNPLFDWEVFEKIISNALKINKIDTTVYLHKLPIMITFTSGNFKTFIPGNFKGYIKIIKCIFDNAVDQDLNDIKDIECKKFIKQQLMQLYLDYKIIQSYSDYPSFSYVSELKCLHQNKSIEIFTKNDLISFFPNIVNDPIPESFLDTFWSTHYKNTGETIETVTKTNSKFIDIIVQWFYFLVDHEFISISEKTYLTYLRLYIHYSKINIISTCFECFIYVLDACYKYGGDYDYNYETGNKEIIKFALSLKMKYTIYGYSHNTNSPGFLFIKYLMKQYLDTQDLDTFPTDKNTYDFLQKLVCNGSNVEVIKVPTEVLSPVEVLPLPTEVLPPVKVEKSQSKTKSFKEIIKKIFRKN